jgi:hypothetical protein
MATYAPKKIGQAYPVDTNELTVYTVPGAVVTLVKQIIVANVTTAPVTASISFVPAAGSAGDSNRISKDISLVGNQVVVYDLSQVLNTGDFITVKASAGNSVVFTISGVEGLASALPFAGLDFAKSGVFVATRPKLNLIPGTNVALTVADNPGAGEVDVTINSPAQSFVFIQGAPANPWVINHNLGFYPNVTVVDSGGSVVEGDITYPSASQVQVAFAGAFAGAAYLS